VLLALSQGFTGRETLTGKETGLFFTNKTPVLKITFLDVEFILQNKKTKGECVPQKSIYLRNIFHKK